jgi:membrane-bound serine protease (ClpP class)
LLHQFVSKAILLASVREEASLPSDLKPEPTWLCRDFRSFVSLMAVATFLFLLSGNVATAANPLEKNTKPAEFSRPFLIEFQGPITETLSKYIHRKVKQARAANADLILLEIDSPGGLKSESLAIAKTLSEIDWAYTVAFIPNKAISGGALVSLGCDEIVIGEKARFGDIGEIYWDPESFMFREVMAKMNSDLIPQARMLAKEKGRPPEFAEAMIDQNMQIFRRPHAGDWEYKNVHINQKAPGDDWEMIPESREGMYLTLEGPRMLELGFANASSNDRNEVSQLYGVEAAEVRVLRYTNSDYIADALCTPWITGLLIVIGLLALYLEVSAPGVGVGGLMACLCAVLFFWSRFFGGTADWLEAILFIGGMIFLAMELFVIPGWGLAGFMGLVMMLASVVMASQDFVFPSNDRQWAEFVTTCLVILCSGCIFLIGAAFITKKLGKIPVFNRLVLEPVADGEKVATVTDADGKPIPQSHPLVSVGDWGKAESLLRPAGRAVFAGRSIDVISDGDYVEPDSQVKVVDIQGNRIIVVAVEENIQDTVHRP